VPKAKKAPATSKKPTNATNKIADPMVVVEEVVEEVVVKNRRGRQITIPQRFK
jgi:hypothetical protein